MSFVVQLQMLDLYPEKYKEPIFKNDLWIIN